MSARSHSSPCASTFAHKSGGMRIDRCTSFSSSGFGGRPVFFGLSMWTVYVMPKVLARLSFA